jgi:hypothetical protein
MKEIRWTAPAFEYHDKGFFWESGVILVAAILIIVSLLFQRNFLFAVFIAIAAGTMIFWGRQKPENLEFLIDEDGIAIGPETRYRYDELAEFSISPYEVTKDNSFIEIVFHKKSAFSTHLRVPAHKKNTEIIRIHLENYLPEFEHEHSLVDHFSRFFKF